MTSSLLGGNETPPLCHHVITCHLLAEPPSPSSDDVIYEQPLTMKLVDSSYDAITFTVLVDMMLNDRHNKSDVTIIICAMMRHHKTV